MTLRLGMMATKSADPEPLARWWAEQTGTAIVQNHGGEYVVVAGEGLPVMLSFQKVPDPTPGRNKMHLDPMVADLDVEVDRLVGVGATLVERRGDDSFRWVTMADPDGNEFCLARSDDAEAEF